MAKQSLLLATSVAVNPVVVDGGVTVLAVKLATEAFELNVRVARDEVKNFHRVRMSPWVNGSVRIGESAGSPVFWCVGDERDRSVCILIGPDDQCWDIAVSVPPDTIDAILREFAACERAVGGTA